MNPLNAELNPICHLLALLGTHHVLHVSRITVKRIQNDWQFSVDSKPCNLQNLVTNYLNFYVI